MAVGLGLMAAVPRVPALASLDAGLFARMAGGGVETGGLGTPEKPRWIGRTEEPSAPLPATLLALDEDREGWFEEIPPPPSDVAVVLARLNAAGLEQLAIGYPLQWESPDTLAVEAMRGVMDRFDGLVLGFPLKDGTAGEPVAMPFLAASVDYAAVQGDATELPLVNAIRGVAPELGGNKTLAGFTQLVTEDQEDGRTYLLARWSDRVVFALPLALEIARRGIDFEDVEIEVGNEIRLGSDGPRIPIDFRGRANLPKSFPEVERIPLKSVIERTLPDDLAAKDRPVFIGDTRVLGPKEDIAWSDGLGAIDGLIRTAPVRVGMREIPRVNPAVELFGAVAVALFAGWCLRARMIEIRAATALGLALAVAVIEWTMVRFASVDLPLLAWLVMPVGAFLIGEYARLSTKVQLVDSEALEAAEKEAAAASKKKSRKKRRR